MSEGFIVQLWYVISNLSWLITTRKRSLRRLCFYTRLSTGGRGSTWAGTPLDQVHPLGRYTPRPGTTSWAGTPPGPGTPPGRYTPQTRYTPLPGPGIPPRTRYTPPDLVLPPGSPPGTRYIPPEQCMLGDTGNKRAVCILLECILVLNSFHTYPNFLLYMRRLKCHKINVKKVEVFSSSNS